MQIQGFKNKPCFDCKEEHFYFAMDMDHVREKLYNMSEMFELAKVRIEAESAKCEATCVNCHRIRTFTRKKGSPNRINSNIPPRLSKYDKDWVPPVITSDEIKKCYSCKKDLSIEWFARRSDRPHLFISRCYPCSAKYQSEWYKTSSVERREKSAANRANYKRMGKDYIKSYKERSLCVDCGKKWPDYVLDFDHILGNKKAIVSSMPGQYPLDIIIQEIAKCEVVCARCHRYRTQARLTGCVNLNPNLIRLSQ
jgi:5-methylcytosine-specific restriction endonuclease McrA